MAKIILSINAGSSSLKSSVFTFDSPTSELKQIASISVEGLTAPPAKLKYDRGGQNTIEEELASVKNLQEAWQYILDRLINEDALQELSSPNDIAFTCHRVVHGGSYSNPTPIDQDTLSTLSNIVPVHHAGALDIVKAVLEKCQNATNIAFFDTAFHNTIPAPARTYAISPDQAQKHGLQKQGSHGISYSFMTRSVIRYLRAYPPETNLILLHLGTECSACCIQGGQSIDTTIGLTPLAGLPGATSVGDSDPSLIFHFTQDASSKGSGVAQAELILNKEFGWKAVTGTTDFGAIAQKAFSNPPDEKCKLAFDILVDRIVGYVGSYFVKLGGEVNALVFAGGVGENCPRLREEVCKKLKFLGFVFDHKANEKAAESKDVVMDVGAEGCEHRILVCKTDEQLEMAAQCAKESEQLKKE